MTTRSLRRLFALFLLVNLLFLIWGPAHRHPTDLTVTFLDVGQGDACVIESPSGKVLVLDTGGVVEDGSDDEGRRVVAPFLRSRGINHIDAILLTHPHADHIGGAATLLTRFPVGLLMDNGEPTDSPLVTRLLLAAREHRVPYKPARRGETMDFGDGVTARLLAPTEAEAREDVPNNASIVLRLQYGRTVFLFTGDAEEEEEEEMVHSSQPLACDVLKVGHHGSDTSTTSDLLSAAHPRFAVVSVGAHNLYGHPSPEVIAHLRASGSQIYRTDRDGAVICRSDGVSLHIETMQPHSLSPR